jgi:uncharacterized membrane protein
MPGKMTKGFRMLRRIRFEYRQISHDLRRGLLLRPLLIALGFGVLAMLLTELESRLFSEASRESLRAFFPGDAASAQVVLGSIAGSVMTVISVVYSILVVALSLASMQFSPRVLSGFLGDAVSQLVLGVFLGTFTYCILVLRAVHGEPAPFVPVAAVSGAVLLALLSIGALIFFIHHIAREIQANHLVDRIAEETCEVIRQVLPEREGGEKRSVEAHSAEEAPEEGDTVAAPSSGYVQLIDEDSLAALAEEMGAQVVVLVGAGEFAVEGAPLLRVSPAKTLSESLRERLLAAFDIGAIRTLQQDFEFGFRQVVDIGLKAISPAVNDPSTAVTCIDHLGRMLACVASRGEAPAALRGARGVLWRRRQNFLSALDLSFHQMRQYGKGDMAVSLRVVRALHQVAPLVRDSAARERLWFHGRLVRDALAPGFHVEEKRELLARVEALREALQVPAE